MNKAVWVVIAILVIAVGWYYASMKSSFTVAPSEGEVMMKESAIAPMMISENAIVVASQKPGMSVNISFASFAEGGYVVAHDEKNGAPGEILGNISHLTPGEARDLSVMLSRASIDKENMFAMLHKDNGDGVFNPQDDAPIKDDEGNIVMMKFMIDKSAGEAGMMNY